jgi:hypothetical protein
MTFKKPPRNSSSGDESPNDDDKADGAPPDDSRGDRPTAKNAENKRLVALLAEERKKREKAQQKLATEQINNRKLRGDIKVSSTEHQIALEKVKTQLAEHKARDRAALGAKNEKLKAERTTSKELLLNKENLLKESLKKRSQLVKELETRSKDLKKAQEANSKYNSERGGLTSAHHDLKGQVKSLETALKKANNEDGARADAKMAHATQMALLKIEGERLHFEREMKRKQDQDDRVKLGFKQRSHLMQFTSNVRAQEKEKESKRKEFEKMKKTKAAEKRLTLSHAAASMNRTTMLNGGAFPRPGVSLHEVSLLC